MRFDASAGLARLALAQGDIGGALSEVHALLSSAGAGAQAYAAEGAVEADEPVAADAEAGNFDGSLAPADRTHVRRVLTAAADPRADAWLQRAYRTLTAQPEAITDAALRQMFLDEHPAPPRYRGAVGDAGCAVAPRPTTACRASSVDFGLAA